MQPKSRGVAPAGALAPTPERQETPGWEFAAFRLDLRDERLWRGADVVPLPPKTFAVLRCLVTRAGQLVTKDALFETVWPETVVSEAVLQVAIRELRRALGDQARAPRVIETVHRRGYRFIAPVRAWVAPDGPAGLGALRQAPRPRFSRPPYFVGRAAALAQLMQWWRTAQEGTRQVGMIAGELGIGKTTLLAAFLAQVSAGGAAWVGHGQCIAQHGAGEPYLPVLEALGRLCRQPDGASLVAVLRQYAPSWLAQLPGLIPPAEQEHLAYTVSGVTPRRMLRELAEALEVFTAVRPLVLVLEDLHWSDGATLAWLSYMARRPDPARVLILGTYRPVDAIVRAHPLRAVLTELQQHGQCMELALDYLSAAEVTAYLRQRFGDPGLAATVARVLHQRTHGNPLFVIAVVDELVRQQVVQEGPSGWEMQGGVERITAIVPVTLQALIEHQLAQCTPAAQTLLAVASVAGVEFAAAAVAAGLAGAEDEIEAQCATLAQQGRFLQARGSAEWPDGTVTTCYSFMHALYQEVLYQRIPVGRQSRWHARIGTRLAQGFGAWAGGMAAALAMHFVHGRMLPQAVPYLRQAGETAMARSAHREAVGYFEQALGAIRHLPEQRATLEQAIDLRLALRSALFPSGNSRRILAYLREAESLAATLNDPGRLGQVSRFLSTHYRVMGANDQAVASGQHALALATANGDVALQALANQYLGVACLAQGDYRQAIDCLRQTVMYLEKSQRYELFGSPTLPAVVSRAYLALCHAEQGTFAEGKAYGEEGLRIAAAVDHPGSLMMASWGLSQPSLRQGDVHQALPLLEQAMSICQKADLLHYFPMMASALGTVYTLCGRITHAVPLLTQALEQIIAVEWVGFQSLCSLPLGEAQLLAGRLEEAQTLAERTLALARQHQEQGHQAYALRLLGDIAARHAPPAREQAETHYRQALALADELGMRPLAAHCHNGLGRLYLKTHRQHQARIALATAIALYRAIDMTFWLPQAESALAEICSNDKSRQAAE